MIKLVEMFQQDFMLNVLAGTSIVAMLSAYLGVFIVLRRAVFVGAALAQVSSLGVALALWIGGAWGLAREHELPAWAQPLALVMTLGASVALAVQYRERSLPRETMIGVVYAAAAALAILVVAISPGGESEAMNLLFGNVLTISLAGVAGLAGLAALVGLVHGLFFRKFLFASFDPDMATALGLRARWWNVLLFLTIGVTISFAIRAAGALVVFNFLVLPAATGLILAGRMRAVLAVAMISGLVASVTGIASSYVWDLPTGPTIVAVNVVLCVAAWLVAKLFKKGSHG
jgi:zinc transport system permease protein